MTAGDAAGAKGTRTVRKKSPAPRHDRLEAILLSARDLFEKNGYHSTTMQEIATNAGMSVGLIYQYASNKEDVLLLVISEILDSYSREVPAAMAPHEDPVERLAAGFAAYCQVVGQRRNAVVLAYRETQTLNRPGRERLKRLESTTTSLLTDEVRRGVADGLFVAVASELIAYDLIMLAHGWALKHWYLAPTQSLDSYISFQTALILRSLILPEHWARYSKFLDI
jgi:AcrR family transcriptional regulator